MKWHSEFYPCHRFNYSLVVAQRAHQRDRKKYECVWVEEREWKFKREREDEGVKDNFDIYLLRSVNFWPYVASLMQMGHLKLLASKIIRFAVDIEMLSKWILLVDGHVIPFSGAWMIGSYTHFAFTHEKTNNAFLTKSIDVIASFQIELEDYENGITFGLLGLFVMCIFHHSTQQPMSELLMAWGFSIFPFDVAPHRSIDVINRDYSLCDR